MNYFDILKTECAKFNMQISDYQINQFSDYYDLLIEWNEKINLTAITAKEEVVYKHFLDSISILNFCNLDNKLLLDVGTGAGFPGIPIAIMNPNCEVVLLDSLNKRINFLNIVIEKLKLENVRTYHGRAEEFGFNNEFRECFDYVTSRAVANLSTLSEYCLPFVKIGGSFVSYKSEHCDEEMNNANNALKILGGRISEYYDYSISIDSIKHRLIFIDKNRNTPKKYPRKAGTPSKSPL